MSTILGFREDAHQDLSSTVQGHLPLQTNGFLSQLWINCETKMKGNWSSSYNKEFAGTWLTDPYLRGGGVETETVGLGQ